MRAEDPRAGDVDQHSLETSHGEKCKRRRSSGGDDLRGQQAQKPGLAQLRDIQRKQRNRCRHGAVDRADQHQEEETQRGELRGEESAQHESGTAEYKEIAPVGEEHVPLEDGRESDHRERIGWEKEPVEADCPIDRGPGGLRASSRSVGMVKYDTNAPGVAKMPSTW